MPKILFLQNIILFGLESFPTANISLAALSYACALEVRVLIQK